MKLFCLHVQIPHKNHTLLEAITQSHQASDVTSIQWNSIYTIYLMYVEHIFLSLALKVLHPGIPLGPRKMTI